MLKGTSKRILIALTVLMLFSTVFASSKMMAEGDQIEDVERKLLNISEEEKEILGSLFIKAQEIEELERNRDQIIQDIKDMKLEIEDLDIKIQKENSNYKDKLNVLKQVLNSYQRMGPGSYIEIILDADNITNLLRRINTLKDLTKNTGQLLDSIEEIKNRLTVQRHNLDEKISSLEEKEEQLAKTIEDGQKKVQELEEHLISLAGDREHYQEQLDNIMKLMDELAILIKDTAMEFAHIIKEGDLAEENVKLRLTKKGMKGTITEDAFNDIVKQNDKLPEIVFHFYEDLVEVEFPNNNLLLKGIFIIVDGQTIKYRMDSGSFYGLILKKESIDELFKDGDLIFNLEPLLWKNTIEGIEIMDGYIELSVNIKLF